MFDNDETGADFQEDHAAELDNSEDAEESTLQDGDEESQPENGDESQEGQGNQKKQNRKEEWPSKAKNAYSRAKKEQNRLRNELNQLRQEMNYFKQAGLKQTPQKETPPDPDQFDTMDDYLDAKTDFLVNQKLSQRESQKSEQFRKTQAQQEQEFAMNYKLSQVAQQTQQLVKQYSSQIPDFHETLVDIQEDMNDMPPEIQQMILSTPEPALTAYNLAKSGLHERLGSYHPNLAAAEILAASKQRPGNQAATTQNKFTPTKGLRGTGGGAGKALSPEKSWNEMRGFFED